MVYCGKPSNSCHACRERKTRCDAKPGGCTQCKRAKRKCPGYRSQVDLIFRDQSQNVVEKAKAREAQRSLKQLSRHPHTILVRNGEQPYAEQHKPAEPDRLDLLYSLQPTVEDRAMRYFIVNHAVGITVPGSGDVNTMTVRHVYNIMDPTLAASVKAASLACYAYHVRSSELLDHARFQYMKAIQRTNSALASSVNANKDSTLLSIILLGLYETLTGQDERSLEDWAEHANGSAALLKLRSHDQFETNVGRRMFLQATGNILGSCLQRCIRVPRHIVQMLDDLAEIMAGIGEYARFGVRIFQAMLQFGDFRCDLMDGTLSEPEAIITRGTELDKPLADVCGNYPPEWRYETVYVKDANPDIVYKGCYHVYADGWVVAAFNFVRMFRIFLHEQLREVLLKGFSASPPTFTQPEHSAQFQRSTDICHEMQADILASVPQALGYFRKTGLWEEDSSSILVSRHDGTTEMHIMGDSPTGPSASGYGLLWPLWYSGFADIATEDVRSYCVKNLGRIGDGMGVQQANVLAGLIIKKAEGKLGSRNA